MSRKLFNIMSLVLVLGCAVANGGHPNPLCWWKFDGDALDSSGNEHHGTLMGSPAPVFTDGVFGQALDLTEGNGPGYVEITDFKGIPGGNPFSICAWINTSDASGTLIGWGSTAGGTTRFEFRPDADELRAESSGNVQGLTNLPDNEWIHVAFTVKADASITEPDATLYLNGEVDNDPATGSNNPLEMAAGFDVTIGRRHSSAARWFDALIDDLRLYDLELTQAQVQEAMAGAGPISDIATDPSPGDGASDIPYYVNELSWESGDFAATHTVYYSASFEDVKSASADALISAGQTDTHIDVPATELGTTYYWRVDEVNAAPDNTVFAGNIWSFTVEPVAYIITALTATASGANPDMGPDNTVNGSGLDALGQHSSLPEAMWLAPGPNPWIQYEFDRAYALHDMSVWNSNQLVESFLGFGIKEAVVETSIDGENWTALEDTTVFAQATGLENYAANTVVALGGTMAKFVKITGKTAYGFVGQMGLSEVQFTQIQALPRDFSPAQGSETDGLDVTLSWRSGRYAAQTKVLMDTHRAAILDGSAVVATTTEKAVALSDLDYAQLYFWQVIDIATDGTPYPSDMMSFYSAQTEAIEDFESYSGEQGSEIFMSWWDGFGGDNSLGGSTTGHIDEPFVETSISKSGNSLPLFFDNNGGFANIDGATSAPTFSAVARDFDGNIDLTEGNADFLALSFRGNAPGFTETDGIITMSGAGADIWNSADEFRFAYKTLNGDGSMVAQVRSLDLGAVNAWSKAGVMIRDTLAADSTFGMMVATGTNGVTFQHRLLAAGAATSDTPTPRDTAAENQDAEPVWVRIDRTGNDFNTYWSLDGSNWSPSVNNPQTIPMNGECYIGLALTSHASGNSVLAEFSDVAFTGNVTGAWAAEAIGIPMTSNDGQDPLYIELVDSSGKTAQIDHPDPAAVQIDQWQEWEIPLDQITGIRLDRIKSILIGVGYPNSAQSGSEGVLYIDDLRVGAKAKAAAAAEASPEGLVAHYEFEGDASDSAGENHGTLFDNASITADGKSGQGLHLEVLPDVNGMDMGGYVAIDNLVYETTGLTEVTVTAWVRTSLETDQVLVSYDRSDYYRLQVNGEGGGPGQIGWSVYTSSGIVDYGSVTRVDDGQWHHVAGVFDNGTLQLFIDGVPQPAATGGPTFGSGVRRFGYIGTGSESAEFNLEPRTPASYVIGDVDDVRIYHRALLPDEVAGLAGL